MRLLIILLVFIPLLRCSIYEKLYAEAEKITMAMSFEQKVGQTIQAEFGCLQTKTGTDPSLALKYSLGSILINGDNVPDANGNLVPIPDKDDDIHHLYLNATNSHWKALADKFNDIGPQVTTAEGKTFKVKLLLGTDAVHGNQHVVGSIIHPHNSGLSCSHNAQNFYNVGYWAGVNVKKSGFNYAFAPTVAVSHNPQWGRFYQTMGQQDSFILNYSKSFVQGLQNRDASGKWNGVLSSAKHFIGDGSTLYGADQGDAMAYSFKNYIKHNVQGYIGAVQGEVGSVMVSYSAVNGIPMSINPMIQNVLKKNLKFDGIVISDYDQLNSITKQQLPTSYVNMTDYEAYSAMINAGIDMFMVPSAYGIRAITQIFSQVKIGIQNNTFDLSRLNEAVTRIVAVKMAMGLVQQSKNILVEDQIPSMTTVVEPVKTTTEYQDSLNSVRESLVLLKNTNNVLPVTGIRSDIQYVVLLGQRIINVNHLSKNQLFRDYDNIGVQCGGWTIRSQGFEGNDFWSDANKQATNASSILDGILNLKGKFQTVYPNYTSYTNSIKINEDRNHYLTSLKTLSKSMNSKNTIIIGVLAESPYSESAGDVGIPYCTGSTITGGDGCRYDGSNPYLPEKQRKTLELNYDAFDHKVLDHVWEHDKNIPLVTVMLAGRPMLINNSVNISSAVIAGWLPGTSGGQGIVDAISGDYRLKSKGDRTNTLSFDWPTNQAALADFPVYEPNGEIPRIPSRLFDVGHGLST